MSKEEIKLLADKLEAIPYRPEIAGKDERGILIGLKLDERDVIVVTLRCFVLMLRDANEVKAQLEKIRLKEQANV